MLIQLDDVRFSGLKTFFNGIVKSVQDVQNVKNVSYKYIPRIDVYST